MITYFLATYQRSVFKNCTSFFLGKVHVSLTDCVQQLISLFRSLCITLGKPYSDKKVRKTLHFQIHVHFLTLSLKLSIFEYIFPFSSYKCSNKSESLVLFNSGSFNKSVCIFTSPFSYLTHYTLTSVCIFSILFSIHFLKH